jgi:SAM-dependent methyltransferase
VATTNEWATDAHAGAYLQRPDVPHRDEGESILWDLLPERVTRVLDLGTGDGRLLARFRDRKPGAAGVAVDFSPTMLAAARRRFANAPDVDVVEHDLDSPLPDLGRFDAVISGFAIHHCPHERKRALYGEVFACLAPGGLFANLDHVASATDELHRQFMAAMQAPEDPSNKLLDVETQLGWLRLIGFGDVDCLWKWRELALLVGRKPG